MLEHDEEKEDEMIDFIEYWNNLEEKFAQDAKLRKEELNKELTPEEINEIRAGIQARAKEMEESLARLEIKKAKGAEMETNSISQPHKTPKNPNDKPWVDPDFSTIQDPTKRKEAENWFERWCTK